MDSASRPDSASPLVHSASPGVRNGQIRDFFIIILWKLTLIIIDQPKSYFFDIYDYYLDLVKGIYQLIKYLISLYDN